MNVLLDKWTAYRRAIAGGILLLLFYQSIWIFSTVTIGTYLGDLKGTGRFKSVNSVDIKYQVKDIVYEDSFLRNDFSTIHGEAEVRYLRFAPSVARLNTFMGNWGNALTVLFVYVLILTFIFIHRDIIPKNARIKITSHSPFIMIIPATIQ